ncbi:thymidine phosphorylase [soil metagenome]
MDIVQLLRTKRDGGTLDPAAITDLIAAYTRDKVPDYQMSAFLMAAFIHGLNDEESAALTRAMLHSGDILDLSDIPGKKVDKHSTGGVGDKVSILLAPIVAACGVPVPMISGRGLGHTGGTLDKLEAIPGFRTDLSIERYREVLAEIGLVMIGQTAEIAPADKKLYALRDVTGTVESIPFIAASIMSKKLAEGIDALVLDVKSGRGAFMREESDARRLAEKLVGIGLEFGKPTVALLTNMDNPLGRGIGNGPETAEAIRALAGMVPLGGPIDDLMEVTLALAAEMLVLGEVVKTPAQGLKKAQKAIDSGEALEALRRLVKIQHGNVDVIGDPSALHGKPVAMVKVPAKTSGFVSEIDAFKLGLAAVSLGAGRAKKDDSVDPKAGFILNKKPGESVEAGEPLVQVYASDPKRFDRDAVLDAFTFSDTAPEAGSMLIARYDGERWSDPS